MSRIKKFRITPELIRAALQLPENALIVNIWDDRELSNTYWMVAQSDEFEEVPEGAFIPNCLPTISEIYIASAEDIALVPEWPLRIHKWHWEGLP